MTTIIAESEVEIETAAPPIVLRLEPVVRLSEDQFFEFCQINQDVRLERTSQREIIVMSPLGGMSGKREVKVMTQLENWSAKNGSGETFSCNTGFRLPNGAMRAPDASWVSKVRLAKFTSKELNAFIPLCPDFVVEVRSPSDRMSMLKLKMAEYIANGAKMGLLINPDKKQVFVYQPDQPVVQVDNSDTVSCDAVLPGFELDLRSIW